MARHGLLMYQDEEAREIMQMTQVLSMNTKIGGTYYTLSEAIGLASAAGVNMNKAFDAQGRLTRVAAQQIQNLLLGYKAMVQTGTILAQDINAVDVQTLEQQTKVQQLNQAWDSFIQTVTGGTSAIAALSDDLQQLGNVADPAGLTKKISAFAGGTVLSIDQIAHALTSFSGTSAQVWQSYDAAVQQAQ